MFGLAQFFPSAEETTRHVASLSVIAERTTFRGTTISGKGDLRIEGVVHADISVDGRVYVAAAAEVYGKVQAQTIRVDGFVRGQLCALEKVVLTAQAEVYATLIADNLRVEAGAQFWGTVQALDQAPPSSLLSWSDKVPALSVPYRAVSPSGNDSAALNGDIAEVNEEGSTTSAASEQPLDEDEAPYGFRW